MEHIVNMHDAKSQLSKLVALAQQGELVMIAIHGKPMVKLVPIKPQPVFGLRSDWPDLPLNAFAPMTDAELQENFGKDFLDMMNDIEANEGKP
jgi:prevent-host-death family protein